MTRFMTALAVLIAATAVAAAQPRLSPRGPLFQQLNLTQEQRDQVQKLRSDFQKKQIQDQAKIRTAKIELRDLLRVDNPDRKTIASKVRDIASFREQAEMNRIDHMLAVRALLTPEQRRLWNENMMNGPRGSMRGHPRAFRGRGMNQIPGEQVPEPEPDTTE